MPDDPPTRPDPAPLGGCPSSALAETVVPDDRAAALIAGRYRPQRLLGRGGAKEVWLAHDLTLERPVAIARARSGAAGAEARERMRREARLMARLGDHPNIVTVFDAVQDEGVLHIVARFMAGGSLAERLVAVPDGRLAPAEVLRTGRSLADALAHAHAHGVVHRDVKPDNVWLAADGSAGLGDFGIAMAAGDALETAGRATGTPYYQAPEQGAGTASLPQSDLYALGATLWELLCGRPPFTGPDAMALLAQHRHAEPEPPSRHAPGIAPELDALVLALLAKRPEDRPPTPPPCATRSTGSAAPPRCPPSRSRPTATRSSGATRARERAPRARRGRRGRAQVVAVAGEPGIGKTRLVDEALAAAARAPRSSAAAPTRSRAPTGRGAPRCARSSPPPAGSPPRCSTTSAASPATAARPRWPRAARRPTPRRSGCGCSTRSPRPCGRRRASGRCASRSTTSTRPTARRSRCSATC